MTPYDVLQTASNLGLHVSATEENTIRIVGPKKNITPELRQYITNLKPEILALLAKREDKVPESFKDIPCRRCGSHEARQREDGVWLCACYWTWEAAPPTPKQRPTWESLLQRNRGLASTCSDEECTKDAAWYGGGVSAFCDEHWPGDRYEAPGETGTCSESGRQPEVLPSVSPDIELRLPEWLKVGTADWNVQVERNGLQEMMDRRQIAIQQEQARRAFIDRNHQDNLTKGEEHTR